MASDGTPGNGTARSIAASTIARGRYVSTRRLQHEPVTGDGNDSVDVFVKDRRRCDDAVSVASGGAERTGDSGLTGVDVSGDGQIVVFTSKAALVANDTNTCGNPAGPCQDIYVHDRGTGQTTRVSVATGGTQANGPSDSPAISRNGRYVAFTSDATNLVRGRYQRRIGRFRPRSRDRHDHARQRVDGRCAGHARTAQPGAAHQRGRQHRRVRVVGCVDGRTRPVSAVTTRHATARDVHDRTAGTTARIPAGARGAAPGPSTTGFTPPQRECDSPAARLHRPLGRADRASQPRNRTAA